MTTNLYTPNISKPSFGNKLSDKFFGTNNVDFINQQNQYEYWKAANINKYSYNIQGMLQAGINPTINTAGLNSITSSPVSQSFQSNLGILGESVAKSAKNLLSYIEPSSKQDSLQLLQTLLGFLK